MNFWRRKRHFWRLCPTNLFKTRKTNVKSNIENTKRETATDLGGSERRRERKRVNKLQLIVATSFYLQRPRAVNALHSCQ